MAAERYGVRREQIVDEANTIGTAWLRADWAGPAAAARIHQRLRDYVGARLDFYAAGRDVERQSRAEALAVVIQREVWAEVDAAVAANPTTPMASLGEAVNEMID